MHGTGSQKCSDQKARDFFLVKSQSAGLDLLNQPFFILIWSLNDTYYTLRFDEKNRMQINFLRANMHKFSRQITKYSSRFSHLTNFSYLSNKSSWFFIIFLHGSQKCSDPKARDLGDHMNSFEPRVPVTTVTPDSRKSLDVDGTLNFNSL